MESLGREVWEHFLLEREGRFCSPTYATYIANDLIMILRRMKQGEDASIEAAVMAISNCLREPVGPNNCSEVN